LAGKILWRNTDCKYDPRHGNGGSPILVGDALIFSCDGRDQRFMVALDKATGRMLWKTPREGESERTYSFSTPLLIPGDQPQIVSPGSDVVNAYDPRTGRELWRVRYTGYSVVPRPVFGNGLVFVCTGFFTPHLLAIRPDGQGDVTATHVAWEARKAVSLTPSPLLVGDELYLVSDNGVASCLDAKTGTTHWSERLGGTYSASPLYAEAKVYFQSEEGTGAVVRAGKKFERLARNTLGERTFASYAAVDGALFIRGEHNLYRVQER
jgi:outer membrane protein assembly factor BamB